MLVLDFSGSILEDEAIRTAFADALTGIASRVEETAATLIAGDATVSIVMFATNAIDAPGCTGLQLRENQAAVAALAGCLRQVADTYRRGVDPALTAAIGDDTNYVAAMEVASGHVPVESARPAIIFFTDGRHEAAGVPVEEVLPARDRLFGARSPFALLPVGMGVDPADRPRLEAGLVALRITRDMERCDGGPLEWPTVVFESAEAAGQAVGLALQDVSCTFTVEPSPPPPTPPPPTPTPTPTPLEPVQRIALVARDASIELTWTPPADAESVPVEAYRARCRPSAGGDWVEATGGSSETTTTVSGLANGVDYTCEVAAIRATGEEVWTPASAQVAPFGPPPAPLKPTVEALDQAARVNLTMPAEAPVTGFTYECSTDGGATWAVASEVRGNRPNFDITGLTNGTEYVCRAAAMNDNGVGEASPVSDVFRPCSGLIDCNPLVLPLTGALVVLLVIALLWAIWRWYAGRRVYVMAQVDQFASISLGRGPNVGMKFVTQGPYRRPAGAAPAQGRDADVRIRYTGGEDFELRTRRSRVKTKIGRSAYVTDPQGATHLVVLHAFDNPPD